MKRSILLVMCGVLAFWVQARAVDYFPLVVGNVWKHEAKIPFAGMLQTVGDATWTITGDTTIGGNSYFVVEVLVQYASGVNETTQLFILDDGNKVSMTTNPNSPTALVQVGQHTYQEGDTWEASGNTLTASACGSYTVSAGAFTSCFAVLAGSDTSGVFAPDVGPLRMTLVVGGANVSFFLKEYDVDLTPNYIQHAIQRIVPADGELFTSNALTRTITFDVGDNHQAVLSLYGGNGRLVKEYQIGGMGTIEVDRGVGSSNMLLRLQMDGRVYTGKMSLAR